MRSWRLRISVTALLVLAFRLGAAQTPTVAPASVGFRSLRVTGGMSWPLSKEGLRQYWGAGPAGSLEFLTDVSRSVALGFCLDAEIFWFRGQKFAAALPAVPMHNLPLAEIYAGVVGRYDLFPRKRLTAYVGASLGFSHITSAIYRQMVNGVRVTYFNIPVKNRLAAGLVGGTEYRLSRRFALDGEAKAIVVHNDPDIGVTLMVRAGIRYMF